MQGRGGGGGGGWGCKGGLAVVVEGKNQLVKNGKFNVN